MISENKKEKSRHKNTVIVEQKEPAGICPLGGSFGGEKNGPRGN